MNSPIDQSATSSMLKRAAYGMLLILGVLLILFCMASLGLLMLETLSADQLKRLNESIRNFGFWMQFIRWAVYLVMYIYWQKIINFWGHFRHWDQAVIDRALKSRFSTAIIVAAVELFLIQSLHVSLYALLMRPAL